MADINALTGLFDSVVSEKLSGYNTVVELDVGTHAGNGNVFLFVEDSDGSEIIDLPESEIFRQNSNDSINYKTIDELKSMSSGYAANVAAVQGANTIMRNYSVYNDGAYGKLPFDLENPDTAISDDLPEIKIALENIRADLHSTAAPVATYTEDGDFDGLDLNENRYDVMEEIKVIEESLGNVDMALSASDTLNAINDALPESDLTHDQKQNVDVEITAEDGIIPPVIESPITTSPM